MKNRLILAFLSIIIIPILAIIVSFLVGAKNIDSQDGDQLHALFNDVEMTIRNYEDSLSDQQLFYTKIVSLLDQYDIHLTIHGQNHELLFDSKEFRPRDESNKLPLDIDTFTIDVQTSQDELWKVEIEANSFRAEPFSAFRDVLQIIFVSLGMGLFTLIVLMVGWVWYITRTVLDPIRSIYQATEEMREGNLDYAIPYKRNDEIGRFIQGFNLMREHLKESYAKQKQYEDSRNVLIASISHDLRTPLSSIKGYVEGLLDGVAKDDEMRERYLKVIHDKSNHLDNLIDDLFEYSKMELEQLPIHKEVVDVNDYFMGMLEKLKFDLNYKEAELEYVLKAPPVQMKLDPKRMRQVIYNLVDNSIQYGSDKIFIQVEQVNKHLIVKVKDNGQGIDDEDLPYIFDSFFRGEKSRSKKHRSGSGLGLSIVHYILKAHHGDIHAESQKGTGSIFTLTLPLNANDFSS
ncbi:sensor histidine kinase [Texcoconibacillus texcoconensis]|uniref:histidine kinase n=1 Tax=Texcoconibacillus texcoconensis TaxID=1095777 RepID=A0A840QKD6_9BACI|nr:HAMP domain-containing sensor histidine kinase [Texcoconibacillus texcoconensis]MBB5171936.1 signal transduction histidine kinase [Texcoconibacillus texcoconensis]